MRRVKIEAKHLLLKFKSHLRGDFGVWHLLKSHFENRHKKPQKPYGIWDFLLWHLFRMHNMCYLDKIDANHFKTLLRKRITQKNNRSDSKNDTYPLLC